MKYSTMVVGYLIAILGSTSVFAEEYKNGTIPPRRSVSETNLYRAFLTVQLMEIHSQLGLCCGYAYPESKDRVLENKIDAVYDFAADLTDCLVVETEQAFEGAVFAADVRAYLEARTAGYQNISDMMDDAKFVLGENLGADMLEAYLNLRRNEIYGMSGRKPNLKVLKAEIRRLKTPLQTSMLIALLEKRRAIWRHNEDLELQPAPDMVLQPVAVNLMR